MVGVKEDIKVPLKMRMKAWWEGYDVNDIKERMAANRAEPETAPEPEKKAEPEVEVEKAVWDEARIAATQLIWGDGYCGPGGPENVIAMSKLLALSPKHSAMVIGAGLGGPSRVLASEFGVWISGYESSDALAERGMQMSIDAGLEKKAPIHHKDLNSITEFERKFDRAYSKESLFTVENKTQLLQKVFEHLKDDSLFLVTDYVVKDQDSLAKPDVISWLRQEPIDPYPVTSDTMVQALENSGFSIRVNEDITDQYLNMISEAWACADNVVQLLAEQGPDGTKNLMMIMKEAEFWGKRTKIMRSGDLKVHRYLAHKASDEK